MMVSASAIKAASWRIDPARGPQFFLFSGGGAFSTILNIKFYDNTVGDTKILQIDFTLSTQFVIYLTKTKVVPLRFFQNV